MARRMLTQVSLVKPDRVSRVSGRKSAHEGKASDNQIVSQFRYLLWFTPDPNMFKHMCFPSKIVLQEHVLALRVIKAAKYLTESMLRSSHKYSTCLSWSMSGTIITPFPGLHLLR